MIIEDLLWVDDIITCGLPSYLEGTLQGSDDLQECEIVDIRACPVIGTVGVILDARSGLMQILPWARVVNAAVLVVRGVTRFESPRIWDPMGILDVEMDDWRWMCWTGQVHVPGKVVIQGCGASLYLGRVPGLPDAQPFLGDFDTAAIRGGWPTWGSEFDVTIEPEHANPHLVGGYVHRLLAGGMAADGVVK